MISRDIDLLVNCSAGPEITIRISSAVRSGFISSSAFHKDFLNELDCQSVPLLFCNDPLVGRESRQDKFVLTTGMAKHEEKESQAGLLSRNALEAHGDALPIIHPSAANVREQEIAAVALLG